MLGKNRRQINTFLEVVGVGTENTLFECSFRAGT